MSQDLSTHAKESISKLEYLYEASELGSKQRALAYNKSVSLDHKGAIIAQLCESSLVYTPHKQRGITRIDFGSGLV